MLPSQENPEPPYRWRYAGRLLVAALVLALAWCGWRAWNAHNTTGIYLASGGQSYVVLGHSPLGSLAVREGLIPFETNTIAYKSKNNEKYSLSAACGLGRLYLHQTRSQISNARNPLNVSAPPRDYILEDSLALELTPSQTIPGDWDLAQAQYRATVHYPKLALIRETLGPTLIAANGVKDFFHKFSSAFPASGEIIQMRLDPAKVPLKSFLHRIDDPRLAAYYQARLHGAKDSGALSLLQPLLAAHPKDPYLTLQQVELLARTGAPDAAARLFGDWQTAHPSLTDPLLQKTSRMAGKTLSMAQLKKKDSILAPYTEVFASFSPQDQQQSGAPTLQHPWSLPQVLNWFEAFLKADQLMPVDNPIVPPIFSPAPAHQKFYSQATTSVKLARTIAIFYLFQGRREEALNLLAAEYRLGQSFNANDTLISRLIGIAVRAIATGGLQTYLLNACETPKDYQQCWTMLERLNNTPGQEDGSHMALENRSILLDQMQFTGGLTPNFQEAQIRHHVSDMKFQLLRMATAAKYHLAASGDFPNSAQDFAPLLAGGLPKDDFAKDTPLHFTRQQTDFAVYSFGPDKTDNAAAMSYDPTNGTTSGGDLIVPIPRQREFPFPREGVHAANAEDLLKQFPNGLPMDAFADTKGRPLGIVDSTTSIPLVVFSFGPDNDEMGDPDARSAFFCTQQRMPTPPGISRGRFLQTVYKWDDPALNHSTPAQGASQPAPRGGVPVAGPDLNPAAITQLTGDQPPATAPKPGLMPGAPAARPSATAMNPAPVSRPRLAAPADPTPDAQPLFRNLEPYYDPTNGTTSNGDLYLEIPRPTPAN